MKFYDFNLRGSNFKDDLFLLKELDKLGWDFVKLNYNSIEDYNNAIKYMDKLNEGNLSLDFAIGLEIQTSNPNEMQKKVRKYNNSIDYISVCGGSDNINRAVVENYRVDVLSKPYFKRRDCGLNHVLAKEAKRNNVAIELSIKDILTNHFSYRAKVIDYYKEILKLHRKFDFPLLLTSGGGNLFDIKSPRDCVAIFKSIGLNFREIEEGFYLTPFNIIDFNLNKDYMVVDGVRVVGDCDEA